MTQIAQYLGLLSGGFLAFWLAFTVIEWRWPRWSRRSFADLDWRTDLAHYFVTNFLVWTVSIFIIYRIAAWIPAPVSLRSISATLSAFPIWAQFLTLIALQDFVQYWVHRAFHHNPFLWKFHAIHHSSPQLDWLANARDHPVDQLARRAAITLVLALLGLSEDAFLLFATIIGPAHAYLVHSNIRLRAPFLNYLIVTPDYHHWHHAIEPKDKNFAGRFPIFDILFGTFHAPQASVKLITGCEEPVPGTYFAQITYPFRKEEIGDLKASIIADRDGDDRGAVAQGPSRSA